MSLTHLSATRDSFNKRSFALATDSENAGEQLLNDGSPTVKNF